jgi:uncharacterized protein
MLRDFVGLGAQKAAVTVIDLSSVPIDVRLTVAAQIGRLAFEFNYWNPEYREFPILLMCEEAHAYIPRASESQFAGARKSMERIAKEGGKYGVGLVGVLAGLGCGEALILGEAVPLPTRLQFDNRTRHPTATT